MPDKLLPPCEACPKAAGFLLLAYREDRHMLDELWAGIHLKLENAFHHYIKMGDALQPPRLYGAMAAAHASGAIIGTGWQPSFYPALDAFLSATRSIPEIIQCCFGADLANRTMKDWFDSLPSDEQARRHAFKRQFARHYDGFRALPLGEARRASDHRTGVAPFEVQVKGRYGTYTGSAATPLPMAETRGINDEHAWLDKPVPLQPMWNDFTIAGKPLFAECQAYLDAASKLIEDARTISAVVHGTAALTSPPT
jgi:hypothetical protein